MAATNDPLVVGCGANGAVRAAPSRVRLLPVYLVLVSLVLLRTRAYEEVAGTPIQASNLHKTIAVALALSLSAYHLLSRGVPRRRPAALDLFALYLATGTVSALRSGQSLYSWWKLGEVAAVFLTALYVLRLSRDDPSRAVRGFELWLTFLRALIVTALAGAAIFPGEALHSPLSEQTLGARGDAFLPVQLTGVLVKVNANSLGVMASILLFSDVVRWTNARRFRTAGRALWIALLVVVLVLAQSRTAWLALAGAIAVALLLSERLSVAWKVVVVGALAAALMVASGYVWIYISRGASVEQLASLSGRTRYWGEAFKEFRNAELTDRMVGLGFASANREILADQLDSGASTLHSDYVDAVISTGWLGLLFLSSAVAAFCASIVSLLKRSKDSPLCLELAGIAVILVVRSLTGTTFAFHNYFLPGFALLSVAAFAVLRRRVGPDRAEPGRALARS